ncbi:MAG: iron donor protein CyaY [Methylotenera sp.]|jgi:CyaY protein|nr:iron donor protein CyaY [Methylotenera sp.]
MSLSDADYHAKAHALLARIEAQIDAWLEEDVVDIDTHRTGGLLELTMPGGSKIVLNTQPPLQEIWLAARSGGYHFKWNGAQWVDREGHELLARLSGSVSEQAGQALSFGA